MDYSSKITIMGTDETIRRLHYLPIILFILIPATFFTTYGIAVSSGRVPAVLPYISDTGTYPPESCIFAQFLNIAAVLLGVVIYIRYSHTTGLCDSSQLATSLPKWNLAGLIVGLLSCLGLSVVGNFQLTSQVVVHLIGAVVCFGCGAIYFWVQVWISYKVRPSGCSLKIAHLRFCLALANTVFFFLIFVGAFVALGQFEGDDAIQWSSEDGGWEWRLVSVISEWLCAGCFCLYILTFAYDFRNIELTQPKVCMD